MSKIASLDLEDLEKKAKGQASAPPRPPPTQWLVHLAHLGGLEPLGWALRIRTQRVLRLAP